MTLYFTHYFPIINIDRRISESYTPLFVISKVWHAAPMTLNRAEDVRAFEIIQPVGILSQLVSTMIDRSSILSHKGIGVVG